MEQNKVAEINSSTSRTGIVYITDNENMFIAPEGISEDEYKKISLEADRDALKKKLATIESQLNSSDRAITDDTRNEEKSISHKEEIEYSQPFEEPNKQTPQIHFFNRKFGDFKNILIFDTETTGINPYKDELLQFSAVDVNGNSLLNSYIKPERHSEWPDAQKVNNISPEMVKDAPSFRKLKEQIQNLINDADLIVTYNGKFDMDFLQLNGIKVDPQKPHLDVMKAFAPVFGEKMRNGKPKNKKLIDAANYYGFNFKAHDSLGDTLATLKVGQRLYGNNFEKLTEEDLHKYSISKTLPQALERNDKDYKHFIFRTGALALQNSEIIEQVKNDPFAGRIQKLLYQHAKYPDNKKLSSSLRYQLGRYVSDNNPGLIENFSKKQKDKDITKNIIEDYKNQDFLNGSESLPDFTLQTRNCNRLYSGMKIVYQNPEDNTFYLDNGKEKLIIPAITFQSIVSPEKLLSKPKAFENAETIQEIPAAVIGKTVLPEFSMIISEGIQTYKNLTVQKYDATEDSYTLSNGNTTLKVTGDTFKEINRPERYEKVYNEETPSYEKLIDSQYDAYFKQWDNTADNFIHNLSVYCRKEANTPLDALTISKEIISRMDKDEKEKTRQILKQIKKEDQTINQVLINTYYEAVKGIPLNKETVLQKQNNARIAKAFNDTISTQGSLIDSSSKLRIGDTIKDMAFNIPKTFGHGKDKLFEDLTVISASKDGNNIILMDKDRSFYELPRDSVLEGYNKQQERQMRAELKQHKSNRIDVGWER